MTLWLVLLAALLACAAMVLIIYGVAYRKFWAVVVGVVGEVAITLFVRFL